MPIIIYNKAWIKQADNIIQIFLNDHQDPRLDDKIQHAFIDLAANGQWPAVRAFVDSGVDINMMPGGRWSALHHAAFFKDTDTIRMLTSRGADKTLQAIPAAGRNIPEAVTPLEVAQRRGAPPGIQALLG